MFRQSTIILRGVEKSPASITGDIVEVIKDGLYFHSMQNNCTLTEHGDNSNWLQNASI